MYLLPERSFLFNQSPRWMVNRTGTRRYLAKNLQSWVYETGSLTQRLRAEYGAGVAVNVLFAKWRTPFLSETQRLHLPPQQYSFIREVLLHVDGKPLILARTVLPQATIEIAKHKLSKLGTRPLGEVIFSYPNLARLETDICCVPLQQWTAQLQKQVTIMPNISGRRTVYAIEQQTMLVSEFFMPDVLQ
jgi:chorismate--pyruvate lyase